MMTSKSILRHGQVTVVLAAAVAAASACSEERILDESTCVETNIKNGQVTVVRYPHTIVVDGTLNDVAWQDVEIWTQVNDIEGGSSFEFAMVADASRLYIGIRVFDDKVITNRANLQCEDSVELLIDSGGERNQNAERACSSDALLDCNDGQFLFEPGDRRRIYVNPLTEVSLWHVKASATRANADGYTMEIALGLDFPTPIRAEAGASFGFDIGLYDADDDSRSCSVTRSHWGRAIRAAYKPEVEPWRWGKAVFCPSPGASNTPPSNPVGRIENAPPSVNITWPTADTRIEAGITKPILVDATDNGGYVHRVEVLLRDVNTNGVTFLGHDLHEPFGLAWSTRVPPGRYTLQALAFDNRGAVSRSIPVPIEVVDRGTEPRWRIQIIGDRRSESSYLLNSYRRPLFHALARAGFEVDFSGRYYLSPSGERAPDPDFDLNHDIFFGDYLIDDIRKTIGWPAHLAPWRQTQAQTGEDEYSFQALWHPAPPDAALVALGNNDLAAGARVSQIVAELEKSVDALRSLNPMITIFLGSSTPSTGINSEASRSFNSAVRELASAKSTADSPIVYVDLYLGFFVGAHTVDGEIPSPAGELKLSERWFEAMNTQLKERSPPPILDPLGGTYSGTVALSLVTDNERFTVVYTVDGTEPDLDSPVYSAPIRLKPRPAPYLIKAKTIYSDGARTSRTVSAEYQVDGDQKAPIARKVIAFNPRALLVAFDEPIDLPGEAGNDIRINGAAPQEMRIKSDGRTLMIATEQPLEAGESHTLSLAGISDVAVPPNFMSSSTEPLRFELEPRGDGLLAEYFSDVYFKERAAARIEPDAAADFAEPTSTLPVDLCRSTPREGASCHDLLSIRWTGYVRPPVDGPYVFEVDGDGWTRMWLDGELLIESPGFVRTRSTSAPKSLSSDQLYEIRVEFSRQNPFFEALPIKDTFSLLWSTDGVVLQPIPTEYLYSAQ